MEAATGAGAVIELVPGVGEFVGPHGELLRVHGRPDRRRALSRLVDVERRADDQQDPAFAMRIVVDTAIRALSPAVNDPTTAVQALDVLEVLVRELAGRDLEASLARDAAGDVRLVWRAPAGTTCSTSRSRRSATTAPARSRSAAALRAVLEDLLASTPPERHPAIETRLRRLDAAVQNAFPEGSPARATAMVADPTGLGLARR